MPVFVFSTTRQLGIFCIECPLYSAPRTNLLSSAARMFADGWSSMSKAQLYQFFLFGSQSVSVQSKIMIYFLISSLLYLNQRDFIKST